MTANRRKTYVLPISRLPLALLLVVLAFQYFGNAQEIPCKTDSDCEAILRAGSECSEQGLCTNPFYKGGCLANMHPNWNKVRVCGSDDHPEAAELGYCRPSPWDYAEVRISGLNWDSAYFSAYLLQILLSEYLEVPTSIELGEPDLIMDYYNPNLRLDYTEDTGYEEPAFFESVRGVSDGNCLRVVDRHSTKGESPNQYRPCMHVSPENWINLNAAGVQRLRSEKVVENPMALGPIGVQHMYIFRRTAARDPTLLSYFGIGGEENRHKLAATFHRPMTWEYYCDEVSPTNCASPDNVAQRAPLDEWEAASYFAEDLFIGYFRATDANDCETYPLNCTGFMADVDCDFVSFTNRHVYHHQIAVEPTKFIYDDVLQIINAANATGADLLFVWSWPDGELFRFIGTDTEMVPIILPAPTKECLDARADEFENCGAIGEPVSACDYISDPLMKLISRNLLKLAKPPGSDPAFWSPAYEAVQNFQITDAQLGEIFKLWIDRDTDKWGYDFREAACEFVVRNRDLIESFIPDGYPRVAEAEDISDTSLYFPALVVAGMAFSWIVVVAFITFGKRRKKVIYNAQVEFIYTVLGGLSLVAVGAFVTALPPNDASCIGSIWLTNLGYGFVFIPLAVRVDAINRLVGSGGHMQRVRLTHKQLIGAVVGALLVVGGFLVVWTLSSPPGKEAEYEVTGRRTDSGDTIVIVLENCGADSDGFYIGSIAWQLSVLLYALVLAFMASRVKEDMNGARGIAALTFLHFTSVGLRAALLLMTDTMDPTVSTGYRSLVYSVDCIGSVTCYMLPKLFKESETQNSDEPLPDLFIDVTLMMADVVGFTKWSSMRAPTEVFKFLETVYGEFDALAEKRNIFKVETVGDCYVAAAGIPHQRPDHAVAMSRFAIDCMSCINQLTNDLEVVYGPDTGDLSLRIGIHSGTVTGGFLRGKGARFQLFGEAMNTTGRLESTGLPNRIQISEATANLLIKDGKSEWVKKRPDKVDARGIGLLQTYWLVAKKDPRKEKHTVDDASSVLLLADGASSNADNELWQISHEEKKAERKRRLVDWNVEVLLGLLKQIVARREKAQRKRRMDQTAASPTQLNRGLSEGTTNSLGSNKGSGGSNRFASIRMSTDNERASSLVSSVASSAASSTESNSGMPLDEVKEIISLPEFDVRVLVSDEDLNQVEIPDVVQEQLKDLVTAISNLYRDNPFHNFAHASHVVMAVVKHMNRIIAPAELAEPAKDEYRLSKKAAMKLHDHTYGITNDPLTQFACVFSALIHDVDHPGVPNAQLIKEDESMAAIYNNRSVAEQNSFDLAWDLIMDPKFDALRETICGDQRELRRFRQLVINSVMATDLGDKELKELRNRRWEKAFSVDEDKATTDEEARDAINRKATIVIEHLIQASDVSHTMQHWHIYREWNENLFREMYAAYKAGRAATNPADFWYKGEIGFFDFYIIPLSKKLRDCGVFGVSSDENLSYATANRAEWEARGQEVVAEMMEKIMAEENEQKNTSQENDAQGDGSETPECHT